MRKFRDSWSWHTSYEVGTPRRRSEVLVTRSDQGAVGIW
jgi:hypothetical protein